MLTRLTSGFWNSVKLAEIVAATPQSHSSAGRKTLSETLSTKTYDKVSDKGNCPAGFEVARLAAPDEVFY